MERPRSYCTRSGSTEKRSEIFLATFGMIGEGKRFRNLLDFEDGVRVLELVVDSRRMVNQCVCLDCRGSSFALYHACHVTPCFSVFCRSRMLRKRAHSHLQSSKSRQILAPTLRRRGLSSGSRKMRFCDLSTEQRYEKPEGIRGRYESVGTNKARQV